jgi:hypothetical protein
MTHGSSEAGCPHVERGQSECGPCNAEEQRPNEAQPTDRTEGYYCEHSAQDYELVCTECHVVRTRASDEKLRRESPVPPHMLVHSETADLRGELRRRGEPPDVNEAEVYALWKVAEAARAFHSHTSFDNDRALAAALEALEPPPCAGTPTKKETDRGETKAEAKDAAPLADEPPIGRASRGGAGVHGDGDQGGLQAASQGGSHPRPAPRDDVTAPRTGADRFPPCKHGRAWKDGCNTCLSDAAEKGEATFRLAEQAPASSGGSSIDKRAEEWMQGMGYDAYFRDDLDRVLYERQLHKLHGLLAEVRAEEREACAAMFTRPLGWLCLDNGEEEGQRIASLIRERSTQAEGKKP